MTVEAGGPVLARIYERSHTARRIARLLRDAESGEAETLRLTKVPLDARKVLAAAWDSGLIEMEHEVVSDRLVQLRVRRTARPMPDFLVAHEDLILWLPDGVRADEYIPRERRRFVRPCEGCGRDFETRNEQRLYCSQSCRKKVARQRAVALKRLGQRSRQCKVCGSHFDGPKNKFYCSQRCYKKAQTAAFRRRKDDPGSVS